MSDSYFTSHHFELLKKWQGQNRDDSNSEQNRAYNELKNAYEVTELWAVEWQWHGNLAHVINHCATIQLDHLSGLHVNGLTVWTAFEF